MSAERETRILVFCIRSAEQVINALDESNADHSEDAYALENLIERWQSYIAALDEEIASEERGKA